MVLDHDVTVGSANPVHNPMRVVPNGEGAEFIFTLIRQPGMPDQQFAEDGPIGGDGFMGEFVLELWAFMKERRKFWLLPIVLVFALVGTLIVLTQGSAVAPFIYTLF